MHKKLGSFADESDENQIYKIFKIMSETNEICLDEKLKLKEYGNNKVPFELVKKSITAAITLCNAEQNMLLDSSFHVVYEILKPLIDDTFDINCLKAILHEYDPQSNFLQGFEINQQKLDECKNNNKMKVLIEMSEKEANEVCGPELNDSIIENFKMAIIVKSFEKNSESFNEEKMKQRSIELKNYEKSLKCFLEQLN
ncbi:hypothetical protein PVAND_016069 [Polypedilum vanderplanki]|uniref:Uncharacterized protein n=1 Tax=Polypedilum vanderplanki TaxID=319348 RepID=A0A9J6BE19_POLVA|nr:hypothetical protein PVAND_016069 [Polypedilum vanderplanki]